MKIRLDILDFHGYTGGMLIRDSFARIVQQALRRSRIVALVGPRQCGKTTLARQFVPVTSANYFDLEDPASLARLDQPMLELGPLKKIIVIDEIQRKPELFALLRVLADRKPLPARMLLLGSAAPELVRQASESLAGRMEIIELTPFALREMKPETSFEKHWLRGGFPLSYLARSGPDSFLWRKNFLQTFIERDVPQLNVGITPALLSRFWFMLAHYHAGIWNAAEMGRSLGVNETTARRYLDVLSGVFMVRQLKPYFANLGKRQVKSPKVYIRDSGLFHTLIGVESMTDLRRHPKYGASFEGYAVEEILRSVPHQEAYFWATHTGAELDLLLIQKQKRLGYEIKLADAPTLTPSMRIALEDLHLDSIQVIYPGPRSYRLAENVHVRPFLDLFKK